MYPEKFDDALRSTDLDTFPQIDLFELGALLRQLKSNVLFSYSDLPRPGLELAADNFKEHLQLLTYVRSWIEALGFSVRGEGG